MQPRKGGRAASACVDSPAWTIPSMQVIRSPRPGGSFRVMRAIITNFRRARGRRANRRGTSQNAGIDWQPRRLLRRIVRRPARKPVMGRHGGCSVFAIVWVRHREGAGGFARPQPASPARGGVDWWSERGSRSEFLVFASMDFWAGWRPRAAEMCWRPGARRGGINWPFPTKVNSRRTNSVSRFRGPLG